MPPLPADFTHARPCKPFCEKYLTLPSRQDLQTNLRKILDTTHNSSPPSETSKISAISMTPQKPKTVCTILSIHHTHGLFSNNYFNFSRISAALTPSAINF